MAKGVIINLNSGSDYTDCSVYTGLTETTATGSTVFTSVTGGTINLEGLSDTLEEVYVKIICVGCCEQIFYVCLNTSTPTPTPTPTVTVTNSQTVTPTITTTPDQPCYCYTYEVTSSEATINYITCDNVVTNISGVTSGATYQICSIVDPVAIEGTATITLNGICVDGNCPTPTPTPTVTITSTPTVTPTVTITQSVTPTITPTVTPEIPVTNITLHYSYQLLSGGPTYNVYNTTSDLTSAQTVYCDMVNRQSGAGINGGVYKHYGPLGVGVQLLTSTLLPAVNVAGYYGTGIVAGIGGVYYYVRTDSSGYVTHYGLVNYCGDSHTIYECFNTCVSSECFCDNSTSTTVYMEVGYSPLDINNVIYADSACTTPWYGDYEYSNTIYSSNPTIQIICNPGGPC